MNLRPAVIFILAGVLIFSWGLAWVLYQAASVGERVAPLEIRDFERLTVVTVGTGGRYENPDRAGPCTAVGWGANIALVDAGRGVAEALRGALIPIQQPRTVYLTSLMPENVLGLDDLLLTAWLAPPDVPLRVVGPRGTRGLIDGLLAAHGAGIDALGEGLGLPPRGAEVDVVEASEGWTEEIGGVRVTASLLSGGNLPALAWGFEDGSKRVVVSGTGWAPKDLVEFATGADLLVHEAVYIPGPEQVEDAGITADPERLERESRLHTSILDVGDLARRARVKALALVRMRPPPWFALQVRMIVDDSYEGAILVPADGEEFVP